MSASEAGDLEAIRSRMLVIQFADDEIVLPALSESDTWLGRVAHARRVLVPATHASRGHSTLGLADRWSSELAAFLAELP
jgi:homoserine O-acetyltransferase